MLRTESVHREKAKILSRVVRKDSLLLLPPDATVQEATQLMCRHKCGAVGVINDQGQLIGLLTDGEIIRKVVCLSKDPGQTSIGSVMIRNPETIAIECDANDALEVVSRQGYRYLPVVEGERVVGILDVNDLYEEVRRILRQTIEQKDALLNYMFGEPYGFSVPSVEYIAA